MSNLRIAELDFDQIKTNLKTFLNAQTEFTDYDFEGSGLSTLLDVLAYNTHYNAYLANMVVNEMFLDSAVKRSSAVSIAKHLGYTPVSARGAVANLDIVVTNPSNLPASLTMDRYTPFTSTVDGTVFTFLTTEAKTAARVGSTYTFTDVDVTEGTLLSYSYVVSDITPAAKYEIPSEAVDTTTIKVSVQTSSSDTTTTTYSLSTDITGIDDTSEIYFLEQNPQGKYQIFFGDGVLGKSLTFGNIITIQYIVATGSVVNVSSTITQSFTAGTTIGGSSSIAITVNSNSTGGADAESITSIKFNAPRLFAAQNRAVTPDDYKALIYSKFPAAQTVSVWGGEDNNPPVYGKTYICIKPKDANKLTNQQKELIASEILNPRSVVSITPEIVDPEYFNIKVTSFVHYNPKETSKTASQIETIVKNAILTYDENELQKFDGVLRYTKLTGIIDQSDPSIINNITRLMVRHPHSP
jgi:hypothetical protein